jgi:hypothetical protein
MPIDTSLAQLIEIDMAARRGFFSFSIYQIKACPEKALKRPMPSGGERRGVTSSEGFSG